MGSGRFEFHALGIQVRGAFRELQHLGVGGALLHVPQTVGKLPPVVARVVFDQNPETTPAGRDAWEERGLRWESVETHGECFGLNTGFRVLFNSF